MDDSSNTSTTNGSNYFANVFDESVILNCVRNRKKNIEIPNCPICSCTIRQGELDSHYLLEIERLSKISNNSKRKLSTNNHTNFAMPSSSSNASNEVEIDVRGCTGSDVYQRVHENRIRRLHTRRRRSPTPQFGECPICNSKLPMSRLQRHALRCLKRTGASMDEDVPDSSSEEGSIDVENDEPQGSFGAEYQWCGEWRVRASALQPRMRSTVVNANSDTALVVDGDEDTELYGPPQYSPSRITPQQDPVNREPTENGDAAENSEDGPRVEVPNDEEVTKSNGLVEASAATRIQALKVKIKELESLHRTGTEAKCLICIGPYVSPAVSIQCWHVYCEVCWLESLRAKKLCPQCNAITTTQHLRRIYM